LIRWLSRALAWFNSQAIECRRVMSDNDPAYVSKAFAKACRTQGLRHIRTRPYTPRTNGKAELFIQTLSKEWACAMAYPNSEERNRWLPAIWRSITASAITRHSAGAHFISD
jgi:transposase InsO family protein